MTLSRPIDAVLAAVASLAVICVVIVKGDALYFGIWYYFVVPAVLLGLCAVLRAKPLFLFGSSCALSLTLIFYLALNWRSARPEGLLGLGHVFSLPGAVVGALIATVLLRRVVSTGPALALVTGFSGVMVGFLINQLLVCNTVMWCGPLSLTVK
jgi:predicted membrane protein